jgi:hypothetical protein
MPDAAGRQVLFGAHPVLQPPHGPQSPDIMCMALGKMVWGDAMLKFKRLNKAQFDSLAKHKLCTEQCIDFGQLLEKEQSVFIEKTFATLAACEAYLRMQKTKGAKITLIK